MTVSQQQTTRWRKEAIEWSASFADWSIAATTTHQTCLNARTTMYGQELAIQTHRYVLDRLNKKIFGHGANRKGLTIGVLAAHGYGPYGTAPHTHLAYALPKSMTYEDCSKLIKRIYTSTYGVSTQANVQPYSSQKWLEYMTNPKKHELLPQLCVKPNFGNC